MRPECCRKTINFGNLSIFVRCVIDPIRKTCRSLRGITTGNYMETKQKVVNALADLLRARIALYSGRQSASIDLAQQYMAVSHEAVNDAIKTLRGVVSGEAHH